MFLNVSEGDAKQKPRKRFMPFVVGVVNVRCIALSTDCIFKPLPFFLFLYNNLISLIKMYACGQGRHASIRFT